MLLLHPVPTSADAGLIFAPCALTFAPCTLTFAPCTYGVSLLSTGATIPLAQVVVVTSCNLRWWCLYMYIYEHEAIQKPKSENNIGVPNVT